MSTPVSWLVVEPGWKVYSSDGEHVGRVEEVLGAPEDDIFSGLRVATGFFSERFIPSERVRTISDGRIDLDLTHDEVEHLPERPPTA